MPLDPSIYSEIIKPVITPLISPQQREAQQALTEQRQALADERRERLQKLRDEALDVAAINQSMASAFPNGAFDPDEFLANVQRSGRFKAAELASKFVDDQNKARAELATKHADAQSKQLENTLKILRAVNPDGSDYPQWRAAAIGSAGDPEGQKLLSQMLPEQFDADALARLQETGGTSKDYFDRKAQAAKDAPKSAEEWMTATGRVLSTPGVTQQQWDDWTKHMASFGGEGKVVAAMAGPLSPENQAKVKTWAISPEKQAELADKAADNLRQAAIETRAQQHQTTQEGFERQRIAIAQHAEARQSAESGANPKLVAEIIKNPAIFATLTPTLKSQLALPLAQAGFDFKGADTGKPSTGLQKRAFNFFNRAKQASEELEKTEDEISKLGFLGQERMNLAPNVLQTPVMQAYNAAQRAFTEARLRKDSGAAIPIQEFDNDKKTYFVQPGDSQTTVAQKRRARAAILGSLGFESGPALGEFYGDEASGLIESYKAQAKGQVNAPTSGEKTVTTTELQAIAKKRGTTVEQEKARATAAGYIVR